MKFTSEDLMKAMGLSVGDKIILDNGSVYEVAVRNSEISLQYLENKCLNTVPTPKKFEWFSLGYLYEKNFEILPRPKRVGDLKCDDILHSNCITCPIKILCLDYGDDNKQLFYEILEDYKSKSGEHFDQEIYDLLKARLDKEVK